MINMNVLLLFVIGLYISLLNPHTISAEEQKVTWESGVVDTEARLPCKLQTEETEGDSPKLILWYKRGLTKPVFTHDGRNKPNPQPILRDRGHVTIIKGTTTLSISHVITSDAGMYECRVDFFFSPSQKSFVNFTVIEPPTSVEIQDHEGHFPKEGLMGPYKEGHSVKLICLSRDGNPSPKITWYRNKQLYDEVYEVSGPRLVINELNISNLTRDWDNNTLRCAAFNSDQQKKRVHETVQLSMYLLPTTVMISGPEVAREGGNITLRCTSGGSYPTTKLTWTVGGKETRPERENTLYGDLVSSTLYLNVTRDHHHKVISCKSQNPAFPASSMISNVTKLEVLYPPHVRLHLGKNLLPSLIKEGDDVYFTCEVSANPKATAISWFHEGVRQEPLPTEGIIFSGNSLVLQKVNQKKAGSYQCEVRNLLGSQKSNNLTLKIRYIPKCKTALTTHFIYDQPINVTCTVAGFPSVNHIMWKWNSSNDVIKLPPKKQRKSDQSYSIFSVQPNSSNKDRELSCWGVNDQGTQITHCKFSIKGANNLAPLSSCRGANITESSLKLTCESTDSKSAEPSLYRAEVYLNNGTLFANVNSTTPSFYIKSLNPETNYKIRVYTTYGLVSSAPVVVSAYTQRSSTKTLETRKVTKSYSSMKTGLWIAGVLVAGTVIVTIFICKQARAQHKNSLHKEESPITISDEQNPDVVPHVETYDLLATTEPTSDKIKYEVRPCISTESTHIGSQSNSRSAYSPRTSPPTHHIECHNDGAYVPMFRKPEEDRISEPSRSSKCDTYCPVDRLLHQAEESVV